MPALLVTGFILLSGCTAKMVTYEQQQLNDADSLFRVGHFEFAKIRYQDIVKSFPGSSAARSAQYKLGYINVYFENNLGSWEAALREFKNFASLYPDDDRIDEVNSWIQLLLAMELFKKNYNASIDKTRSLETELNAKDAEAFTGRRSVDVNALNESLRSCTLVKDSLQRKTKELENLILELDERCQQAIKDQ